MLRMQSKYLHALNMLVGLCTLDCSRSLSVFSTTSERWSDKWRWVTPAENVLRSTVPHVAQDDTVTDNQYSVTALHFKKGLLYMVMWNEMKIRADLVGCRNLDSVSSDGRGKTRWGSPLHPACSLWSLWPPQHWNDRAWSGPNETEVVMEMTVRALYIMVPSTVCTSTGRGS